MTMSKSTDSSDMNSALYSSDVRALDFGMLYEKFKRPVHSYIYRLLGSYDNADDLTQEVFTRAYVAWNDLYDRENLSSWLYRIATNLCIDQLRRRKRIPGGRSYDVTILTSNSMAMTNFHICPQILEVSPRSPSENIFGLLSPIYQQTTQLCLS